MPLLFRRGKVLENQCSPPAGGQRRGCRMMTRTAKAPTKNCVTSEWPAAHLTASGAKERRERWTATTMV
ncbi:piggyBac transposable element-derived protein 3 [Anopheles sinensis]|uniref:PiggyBac transposable element-derived protein 3 n=1 Tax=Anopheles sinensis TaxID=74873 RepID=A0A084VSK0_ANOSI|nr:piggyBac transposable element-derived protein 3 [Anopheles sinensis]